jgi:hypothetical protein
LPTFIAGKKRTPGRDMSKGKALSQRLVIFLQRIKLKNGKIRQEIN